ncbi:MAG: hypothetical protein KME35_05195 [Aphanocapsa sp. GSE-SYN-MK-11-07L]|jgi:methylglyoxal synthase|nr:hypothetical protein [Aphanocapsa sp. GSE-SYN-MK-11-07L]
MSNTIALIAHDAKKDEMVDFVIQHKVCLARYRLIATDTTVVLDGEVIGTTPIEVECIPNGLTVFVPNLG